MVDMRMRDEDVLDALELARRQIGKIAEVEEDRAPLEQRRHIDGRIAESSVDERGMEERPHGAGL